MPNIQDVFNKLVEANTKLQLIHDDLGAANDRLGQLVDLGTYANHALAHNAAQNDTIICILEKVSEHTCRLVNESHAQTTLQTSIERSGRLVADLFEATHAEAAFERRRDEELREQIEKCCPPERPEPPCGYEPCKAPRPLPPPPKPRDAPVG